MALGRGVGSEAARIDSGGRVLRGKSATQAGTNTAGEHCNGGVYYSSGVDVRGKGSSRELRCERMGDGGNRCRGGW